MNESETKLVPDACIRRSFVYRKLLAAGAAEFVRVGDAALANVFADAEMERARVECAGLADLSPLPRTGFKGRGCVQWLGEQRVCVPDAVNRAVVQDHGAIAARLDLENVLVLGNPLIAGGDRLPAELFDVHDRHRESSAQLRWFSLRWQDSHAWFVMTGAHAPEALAEICSVDLRPHKFPENAVAQTAAAGVAVIVIRTSPGGRLAYHLLVDSSYAGYFFDRLHEAAAEAGGGVVGLQALHPFSSSEDMP